MPRPFVKAVALSGAVAASALFAFSANAAQVLTPKRGAAVIDNVTLPAGTSLAAGSTLFIDVDYSVTGSQTANEAGLGLKIGYDSFYFDVVVPATGVTSLHTKCMIASPSDQLVSGTTREVVFGWIDTSIRTTPTAGAVGWPGTADPAAPGSANGCLNPGGIVLESGAITVPTTLFRIGLKSKATLGVGQTTNVTVNTAGNISYANAGNVDTAKTIKVNGAAAPTCNLDVDGSGGNPTALVDGLLIQRALNGNITDANVVAGIAFPGTATRTTGAAIRAYLASFVNVGTQIGSTGIGGGATVLDVDGSGSTNSLVDGLVIKRALNTNITAANVVAGVSVQAGTTGQSVRTLLNSQCGLSLPTN